MRPGQAAPVFGFEQLFPVLVHVASMRPGQAAPVFVVGLYRQNRKLAELQ